MRNFFWSQPALNFGFASPTEPWMLPVDHPDVLALQEELKRVLRFWMDMGADGFRADMAGALVKTEHVAGNDQFFTARGEGTKVFGNKIRALMETYPFVYARANGEEAVLVILNPGESPAEARFRRCPGTTSSWPAGPWRRPTTVTSTASRCAGAATRSTGGCGSQEPPFGERGGGSFESDDDHEENDSLRPE